MKQFLYLDTDRINSIIAQKEKGLIEGVTSEKEDEISDNKTKQLSAGVKGEAGTNILKLAKAEASLNVDAEIKGVNSHQTTTREIIAKTLHDAAFDMAYSFISPVVIKNDKQYYNPGEFVELCRTFQIVDIEYLEGLISKSGILDIMEKTEKEKIEKKIDLYVNEKLNRDQKRHGNSYVDNLKKETTANMRAKYDNMTAVITMLGKIIPYKRMLVSKDGFIIPLEDNFFRVNPHSIGFMFGGIIKCVGMITNIICDDKSDDKDLFATIQSTVNEALRGILQTDQKSLYVVSPLAIYYEK